MSNLHQHRKFASNDVVSLVKSLDSMTSGLNGRDYDSTIREAFRNTVRAIDQIRSLGELDRESMWRLSAMRDFAQNGLRLIGDQRGSLATSREQKQKALLDLRNVNTNAKSLLKDLKGLGKLAAAEEQTEISYRSPGEAWSQMSFDSESEASKWIKQQGDDMEVRWKEASHLARRIAHRHLAAVDNKSVVPSSVRQKVNAELIRAGMDGNRRFRTSGEALGVISGVLAKNEIEWDEVLNAFQFGRPKGRASIDLASQTDDPFSPVSIQNTALAFHWDTLENGVEVIAYLG